MNAKSLREFIQSKESEKVKESSLTKVWKHSQVHDVGTITAFRSARYCNDGVDFTKKENEDKNAILKAQLLKLGYGVTAIKGYYIENYKTQNEKEVKENSFLVVDLKDTGNLKKDLVRLGEQYEQDSITYQNYKVGKYFIISSNKCPNGYPGSGKIGVERELGKSIFGKKGEFFSKVNGRPFVFETYVSNLKSLSDYFPTEIRGILKLAESSNN